MTEKIEYAVCFDRKTGIRKGRCYVHFSGNTRIWRFPGLPPADLSPMRITKISLPNNDKWKSIGWEKEEQCWSEDFELVTWAAKNIKRIVKGGQENYVVPVFGRDYRLFEDVLYHGRIGKIYIVKKTTTTEEEVL